jgi:hypothetical protein
MNATLIQATCRRCGRPLQLQAAADCPAELCNTLAGVVECETCTVRNDDDRGGLLARLWQNVRAAFRKGGRP